MRSENPPGRPKLILDPSQRYADNIVQLCAPFFATNREEIQNATKSLSDLDARLSVLEQSVKSLVDSTDAAQRTRSALRAVIDKLLQELRDCVSQLTELGGRIDNVEKGHQKLEAKIESMAQFCETLPSLLLSSRAEQEKRFQFLLQQSRQNNSEKVEARLRALEQVFLELKPLLSEGG